MLLPDRAGRFASAGAAATTRICGLYDTKPTKFGLTRNQVTFAKNFGDQTEVFTGVDLNLNARLPRRYLPAGRRVDWPERHEQLLRQEFAATVHRRAENRRLLRCEPPAWRQLSGEVRRHLQIAVEHLGRCDLSETCQAYRSPPVTLCPQTSSRRRSIATRTLR